MYSFTTSGSVSPHANAVNIPRYAAPTQAELEDIFGTGDERSCENCRYYRPASLGEDGGYCIYDIYKASKARELSGADLVEVDPRDEPCRDYRRELK